MDCLTDRITPRHHHETPRQRWTRWTVNTIGAALLAVGMYTVSPINVWTWAAFIAGGIWALNAAERQGYRRGQDDLYRRAQIWEYAHTIVRAAQDRR